MHVSSRSIFNFPVKTNLPQSGVIHQIMYGAEYIQDNSEIFSRHAHSRKVHEPRETFELLFI